MPFPITLPYGIESANPDTSPLADYTMIYLPYCSGDVFVGDFELPVSRGRAIQMRGKRNLDLSLDAVEVLEGIRWENVNEFVLYGASAGALGAILNLSKFEKKLPPHASRALVADSPGLHFGKRFWERFPLPFIEKVSKSMSAEGMQFSDSGTPVAQQLGAFCEKAHNWNIGFLQAEADVAMSAIFGTIAPSEHSKLVYGPHGILQTIRAAANNCAVWVHPSPLHTFALAGATAGLSVSEKSAMGFASQIVNFSYGDKSYAAPGR